MSANTEFSESYRSIYSSQKFKRLSLMPNSRPAKTSQAPRAFPHQLRNKTLDSNKQNLGFASYMKKVESAVKIDEKAEISKYLWSLRKEYDKLSKGIKQTQFKIHQMQKQIKQFQIKHEGGTGQATEINNLVQIKEEELQSTFDKQKEAKMDNKIFKNIIDRMKNDALFRKCEGRNNEQQIKEKQKALKTAEDLSIQWDESIHKMAEKLMRFQRQLEHHHSQRKLKLAEYQSRVGELQEQQNFQLERKQRTYQLLSMQSNDITDAKNMILRDALFANKFMSTLLENKIEELLRSNQFYEDSYHQIKAQTNIDDPKQLCSKFISYPQVLKQISDKINIYEHKLDEVTAENKRLRKIQEEKKAKRLEQEKVRVTRKNDLLEQKQNLRLDVIEKELLVKKIKDWIRQNSCILNIEEKSDSGSNESKLRNLCQYLRKEIKNIENLDINSIKFEVPSIRMKKVLKEISYQDEKQKRNQALQVYQSNACEAVYIKNQRKQVKRNKFLIKNQMTKSKKQ